MNNNFTFLLIWKMASWIFTLKDLIIDMILNILFYINIS